MSCVTAIWKFDESGHRVFVKGKEVALPNKEFELLLFFAKNPDIVFSKETRLRSRLGQRGPRGNGYRVGPCQPHS